MSGQTLCRQSAVKSRILLCLWMGKPPILYTGVPQRGQRRSHQDMRNDQAGLHERVNDLQFLTHILKFKRLFTDQLVC